MLTIQQGTAILKQTVNAHRQAQGLKPVRGVMKYSHIKPYLVEKPPIKDTKSEIQDGIAEATMLNNFLLVLKARMRNIIRLNEKVAPFMAQKSMNNLERFKVTVQSEIVPKEYLFDSKGAEMLSARAKTLSSLRKKFNKKIKTDIIVSKKDIDNFIRDTMGARLVLPTGSSDEVEKCVQKLVDATKKGTISIIQINNYHGKGITPYLTDKQIKALVDVTNKKGGFVVEKKGDDIIKKSGYTCAQINFKFDDTICEIQYRGKQIDGIASPEHIFYKYVKDPTYESGFKKIDEYLLPLRYAIVKLTPEQIKLFRPYLHEYYAYARNNELGILSDAPVRPGGFPEELDMINIMKMYKRAVEIKNEIKNAVNNVVE